MNCVCLLQLPAWHKAISTNCLTQLPCWEQPRTFVLYLVFSGCSLLCTCCHICFRFQCFKQGAVLPWWKGGLTSGRLGGTLSFCNTSSRRWSWANFSPPAFLAGCCEALFESQQEAEVKKDKRDSKTVLEPGKILSLPSALAKLLQERGRKKVSISTVLKLWGEVVTSGYHLFASNILLLAYSLTKSASIGGHWE